MSFLDDFREHVIPQLSGWAKAGAICVSSGAESWGEAWDCIMRVAIDRGALYLSPYELGQLEDWISTTLLEAIDAYEQPVDYAAAA